MKDKSSPPLVKDDRVVDTHVYVGTNVWFNHWLADPKIESFRYECPEGSFTARRRKGDYWNAYRKVKGKLRQEYLGKADDLTQTKLIETARTLAMDNTEYWRMKYPRPDQLPQPSQESTGLYNHSPTCITEAQEAKVIELQNQLIVQTNLVGQYQRDIAKLRQQLSDLQRSQPDPDPAAILNRLRKERKKSKAELKDVELIIELLQAIAL